MEGRRSKRNADAKEMTPVQIDEVCKSSRNILAPKRLQYTPPHAPQPMRKHNFENLQHEEDHSNDEEEDHSNDEESNVEGLGLSAYELERLENIKQNQAFLSSINLPQAFHDLKQSSAKRQLPQKGLKRSSPVVKEVLPPRKSLRLQNKSPLPSSFPELMKIEIPEQAYSQPKKSAGQIPMEPMNMDEGSKLPPQLIQLFSEVSSQERGVELGLQEYISTLKKMTISEDKIAKVVKKRIYSAAFHPASTSLLMAAGDKFGNVGLWSLGSNWGDDGVLLFEPHTRAIGCLAFSRTHPAQLLSLSYDGSLRCTDVEKGVFDDVYDIEDGLKTFDFLTGDYSTLVVGNWFGGIAIVDRRTPGNSHESFYSLDCKVLRCVSVHPCQRQYFAVAESREVNIYDTRCLKKTRCQPVSQLRGHSLSIPSCYFSPCTGNRVVTSCMDNNIRIFDTSALTAEVPLLTSIHHNMRTGRWLSKLSAVWDPKREDCLLVGSMEKRRQVMVFHETGRPLHKFVDGEHLNTVLSVTAFHPARNAILGGNASGRLHVFSD
ncbi:WD repeat-containing protein 76-like isoform X2 [Corythoichthys intestinalis]|uniref:WD repeat-containing protein 76-like isoform X2 n=1 Tax=Corythoichthys intestinalis TaxID=161448 RepID=UPI0025A5BF57|nr:WD repeat-containing protein 76-like isoform X2 [Corythoichthys intestinalis]